MFRDQYSDRILVFSHIPKTAGTTLNYLLRRRFGMNLLAAKVRKDSGDIAYRPVDLKMDLAIYRHCQCLSGHGLKPYVNFQEFQDKLRWFTFVRRPADRFLSLYIHQFTSGKPQFKLDFIDWAKKFKRDNGMVRMIAGEANIAKAKDILHDNVRQTEFVMTAARSSV